MSTSRDYLERLAAIDAAVARAQPDPALVLERAAGLIAGRVGCRIDEAHAQLRQLAAEQYRDVWEVAAEVVAALESRRTVRSHDVRAAVADVLRATPPESPARPAADRTSTAADWTVTMQQALEAVSGRHTVVEPRRGADGEIEDFTLVAVSPTVVDLSGRRGTQLVGRSVREVYPTIVDGPIWHAWTAAVADGVPREVGPLPYEGGDSGAQVTIMVRIHRVGPGLLNSWVRQDEESRLAERLAHTERLGSLGWGEWDLLTGSVAWSDELYRIYERDPAAGPLRGEESEALRLPEDEPIHRQAAASFGRGETVDVTYRLRIGSRIKHVRSVVDAVRDTTGRPIKVYGIVQDVTARETSRAKLAEVEQELREQRASLATEHRLAAELQHIVLPIPAAPIDLPGMRVAVRYVPAEQASRVGGDWYHAGVTNDGDVLLAVGDVAGHGIRAATTMARLRHALAALSITSTTDPAELLAYHNRLLRSDGAAAETATAEIARDHPAAGELVWAQAGHPPPLLARGADTVALDRPHGPLLGGVRNPAYETVTTTLRPDDLLLFYTDGLIEDRRQSTADGFAPAIRTLTEHRGAPLMDLLALLTPVNAGDDTCILAARPCLPANPS